MYHWTETKGDAWILVGGQNWVRLSEIAAVYDGSTGEEERRMVIAPDVDGVRSIILLRSGQTLPAFVSAKTLMKRIKEAQHAG